MYKFLINLVFAMILGLIVGVLYQHTMFGLFIFFITAILFDFNSRYQTKK
ncbi:hypothetical protein [Macrococcus brunensis]|nr:hypothetical protein [Macrococcus brunensis]